MFKQFNNIAEMLENSAIEFKNNIAFKVKLNKDEYNDITYEQFLKEIKILSAVFMKKGYTKKRIALIGNNSYEWLLVLFTSFYTGSVCVPLDKNLLEYEIQNQLSRSESDVLFVTDNRDTSAFDIKIENDVASLLEEKADDINIKYDIDENALSLLLFTSGTTQKSKAVMLSQLNIVTNLYGLALHEPFKSTDVNMIMLPLHHTFGMVSVILFLSLGMTNTFCDGLKINKSLAEYKPDILVCVPLIADAIYKTAWKQIRKSGKENLVKTMIKICAFLRKFGIDIRRRVFKDIISALGGNAYFVIVGGAALDKTVEKWFNDIGILTVQGYGLTECSPVLSAENPSNMRYGSIGIPLPNVEMKIIDEDQNGLGEIIAKGKNIMLGYYNEPELTDEVLKDGWFYTGDVGYKDKDGYYYITGRKKNVIVLENGKNVFPEETEELIYKIEYVKECLVFADKDNGKDVMKAKIVYDTEYFKDLSQDEIHKTVKEDIKQLNTKLTGYKQIKDVIVTSVPMERTTTFKIKRFAELTK